jgi:sialate O-acetylesterase
MEGWANIREANRAEKNPKKRKKLPRKPQKPSPPALSPKRPGAIYNGMIHPWAGYAMKGAIW